MKQNDNDMKPSWFEAFVLTAIFALVCFLLLSSCKTVYRDVEVIKRDTLVVKDSVKVTDTITKVRVEREVVEKEIYKDRTQDYTFGKTHPELGFRVDTVRIYERIYEKNSAEKAVIDSLRQALLRYERKDSLASKDNAKVEKAVVEKKVPPWRQIAVALGCVLIALIIYAVSRIKG